MMLRAKHLLMAGLLVAALQPPAPAEAQIKEVRQTVFGMDCAPCAYAVERRMGNMDGARNVQLSLNEGFAAVRFEGAHGTTLDQIRTAVRDSGFGPRGARIRLQGNVTEEDGARVLRTPAGERYLLVAEASGVLPEDGAEAEVEGEVDAAADGAGRWVLRVERSR
jgi:copper chaperone CopZ